MNKSTLTALIFSGCLFVGSSNIYASTSDLGFVNSAEVLSECRLSAPGGVNFGVYDPLVAHVNIKPTATLTISYECALRPGAYISIVMGVGNNPSAYTQPFPGGGNSIQNFCKRRMRGPQLDYIEYRVNDEDALVGTGHRDRPTGCTGQFAQSLLNTSYSPTGSVSFTLENQRSDLARAGIYTDIVTVGIIL